MNLDFLLTFPWLLLIGALAPIFLLIPLLVELLRRKDRGPRPLPRPEGDPTEPPQVETPVPPGDRGGDIEDDLGLVRIEGNLEARGSEIHNHLIIKGHIALPAGTAVEGTIKATEYVEVGEAAQVKGDIIAGGDVLVQAGARVEGIIVSRGAVTMGHDAAAAAVIAKKGTTLAEGVEVLHRIISGEPIRVSHAEVEQALREQRQEQPSHDTLRGVAPPAEVQAPSASGLNTAPPPPTDEPRLGLPGATHPRSLRVPSIQVPMPGPAPTVEPSTDLAPPAPAPTPSPPSGPILAMPKVGRKTPAGRPPRPSPSGAVESQGKVLLRFPEGGSRARKKA